MMKKVKTKKRKLARDVFPSLSSKSSRPNNDDFMKSQWLTKAQISDMKKGLSDDTCLYECVYGFMFDRRQCKAATMTKSEILVAECMSIGCFGNMKQLLIMIKTLGFQEPLSLNQKNKQLYNKIMTTAYVNAMSMINSNIQSKFMDDMASDFTEWKLDTTHPTFERWFINMNQDEHLMCDYELESMNQEQVYDDIASHKCDTLCNAQAMFRRSKNLQRVLKHVKLH